MALATRLRERAAVRRPTSLQIALADRIGQLDRASWDAVSRGQSFFFSRPYLEMLQAVAPENVEPRFALVCRGDEPLAGLCAQVIKVSLAQVADSRSRKLLAGLDDRVTQRVLMCGNALTFGMHAVCFAPGAERSAAWPGVAEALYRMRRAEKLSGHMDLVVIKDLAAKACEESAALEKLSYARVETEPDMVLALDPAWKSHADYLGSLNTKYRGNVKSQVFRRFDEAGCRIEAMGADQAESEKDALHKLYLEVHGAASLRPFTLRPGYWPAIARATGENGAMLVARHEGRLAAFIFLVKDGDTSIAYHIGFDRAVAAAGVPLYLRMLHASVEQSIRFGCKRVSFGRTALEPKARLGCKPEPMFVWARHRHPVVNQLLRPLLGFIQHAEAPDVDPFRKAASAPEAAA
jgi:predicted N-acyltransferase